MATLLLTHSIKRTQYICKRIGLLINSITQQILCQVKGFLISQPHHFRQAAEITGSISSHITK